MVHYSRGEWLQSVAQFECRPEVMTEMEFRFSVGQDATLIQALNEPSAAQCYIASAVGF